MNRTEGGAKRRPPAAYFHIRPWRDEAGRKEGRHENLKDKTVLDILQEIVGIDKDIRLDPPMENIREERRKYGR